MNEQLTSQVTIAIIVAHILEWLKANPKIPFVRYGAFWINAIAAAGAALVSAGVLEYTFDPSGAFTMSGNIYGIMAWAWTAVQQYALQHIMYRTTVEPPPTPMLTKAETTQREKGNGK